ncbi:DUF6249 domain-containing protein [Porticoccaceae bacterium]|nr:DUF6249 domain-containing protein [Porticoccaceae bacterium]MDA8651233.1 DUF6249 domain-containing protein [Porticoccaceae bacterium]MDA8788865.1 DUF6249 domain-containing protein [Porticoccaceae bacterium]MDB2634956.1 DUF6249 domain-containing protein [Porticoccaceae bacterium]
MKSRFLKPLALVIGIYFVPVAMVATILVSPTYAMTQTEDSVTGDTPQDSDFLNIGITTNETDGSASIEMRLSDHNLETALEAMSDELQDELNEPGNDALKTNISVNDEHTVISISGDGEKISSIKNIIATLSDTEWDDLPEEDRQAIMEAAEILEDGVEINISGSELGFGEIVGRVVAFIIFFLLTFGLPFTIIALILFYKHRKRRQRMELVSKFIDAGKEVPEEILRDVTDIDSTDNSLKKGIRLIGVSTGVLLFLGILVGWGVASVALIPLFIGIARVVSWKLNSDDASAEGDK